MNFHPHNAPLLLHNIQRLYPIADAATPCLRGAAMATPAYLDDAYLLVEGDRIAALGPMAELNADAYPEAERIDCSGRLVLPGFVDSHTHLVFPRSREHEFEMRLRGMTYEEIARQGGGILNSAQHTAETSEDQLFADAWARLHEIARLGTTTVEIKSGYGLSLESELKLLRVAKRLKDEGPLTVKTTFLGAHAIPQAYREQRQAYIDLVCEEMLPRVVEEGLADFIDVFCDEGFFTPEETTHILRKGAEHGLPGKIHANELAISGGVQAGVACDAYSVDHLEQMGPEEVEALRGNDTVPTLLPTVAFFLGIPYGPARALIEADLPLALATDYNPGSSPGGSMPFVMSLACFRMGLLPEEALVASTLNGAFALRMSDRLGGLWPGAQADLIVTEPIASLARIPYSYASNLIDRVMARGNWVEKMTYEAS